MRLSLLFLTAMFAMAAGPTEPAPSAKAPVVKTQGFIPFGEAPINYRSEDLRDPIAILQKRMDEGKVKLHHVPGQTYLPSVLKELKIPVNSQTLVYSKTSFQYPKISHDKPRALYFNDDVYVGRVHDGTALEFVSFDPMQGAIFYILDETKQKKPRFERSNLDCIQCHVANVATKGVPGVMVRSITANESGFQKGGTPAYISGHESPLAQRWGGWYVTAKSAPPSMGLTKLPATSFYLTGTSDIVAHLVLDHQTQMHNLITQTNYQARLTPGNQFERPAEQLVKYLLFANEAKFDSPIQGDSGYAEEFAAKGPRDPKGRSLRDFDLKTRLFRYPLSYLIYSEAFDTIPDRAKSFVYRRLLEVLTGRDQSPGYAALSTEDRRAILEILVATKPNLPAEFYSSVSLKGNSQ